MSNIYQLFEARTDGRVAIPVGGGRLQTLQEVRVQPVQLWDLEEDGVEVLLGDDRPRRGDCRLQRLHVLQTEQKVSAVFPVLSRSG